MVELAPRSVLRLSLDPPGGGGIPRVGWHFALALRGSRGGWYDVILNSMEGRRCMVFFFFWGGGVICVVI